MTTDKTTPAPATNATPAADSFDSVFSDITAPEPATVVVEDATTAAVDNLTAASTPATDAASTAETTPTDTAPDAASTAPADASPTPVEAAPAEVDWKARFEALQAERTTAAEPEPTPAPAVAPTPAPESYTAEEKQFLTEYEKEWPDVTRGEALKRRAEYQQVVGHIFREIEMHYGPLIERGAAAADSVAESSAVAAIRSVHTDYDDTLYTAVVDWADQLKGMRKVVAQQIINEGEPQDVIDLISEFKTTARKVVADGAPTSSAGATVTEISATAKKAAKALGVVESKRTVPVSPEADADDFDGAWVEAAGKA